MRYRASHDTRFRFSSPVFLEPHTIRLRPRSDSWQSLDRFEIQLDPKPSLLAEAVDAEGNDVVHVWFSGMTDSLTVRTDFVVETLRSNPFDYLALDDRALRLPVKYPGELGMQLASAIDRAEPADRSVSNFASAVANRSHGDAVEFLSLLSQEISGTHAVVPRDSGDPNPAAETLEMRQGACRDLAVLFMDCCRSLGIASRFVSGYHDSAPDIGDRHLHAWAEVYLPGGGWRGYDPSQGLAVSDRHIAVAASAVPRLAAPTSGTFRGDASALPLEACIRIDPAESITQQQDQ